MVLEMALCYDYTRLGVEEVQVAVETDHDYRTEQVKGLETEDDIEKTAQGRERANALDMM